MAVGLNRQLAETAQVLFCRGARHRRKLDDPGHFHFIPRAVAIVAVHVSFEPAPLGPLPRAQLWRRGRIAYWLRPGGRGMNWRNAASAFSWRTIRGSTARGAPSSTASSVWAALLPVVEPCRAICRVIRIRELAQVWTGLY